MAVPKAKSIFSKRQCSIPAGSTTLQAQHFTLCTRIRTYTHIIGQQYALCHPGIT